MARKTTVELVDDLDGSTADETVNFALDGITYEIDLSAQHAGVLRDIMADFTPVARRVGKVPAASKGTQRSTVTAETRQRRDQLQKVRTWAREHNLSVNDRGRISRQLMSAYEANDPNQLLASAG